MAFSFTQEITHGQPNKTQVLDTIARILGTRQGWFIAGGYAFHQKDYGDIDIFFTSANVLAMARNYMETSSKTNRDPFGMKAPGAKNYRESEWALTKYESKLNAELQFIKRVDTLDNILGGFDLSPSKIAMLPDGTIYKHKDFSDTEIKLHTNEIKMDTINRVSKYAYRHKLKINAESIAEAICYLADNPNGFLTSYYDGKEIKIENIETLDKVILQMQKYKIFREANDKIMDLFSDKYPEYLV